MRYTLFSIFLVLALFSCNDIPAQKNDLSEILSSADYAERIANGDVTIIDVRTPAEYAEGHIENAININVNSDNFESHFAEFDKEKPLYIYCRSGGRSQQAAKKLHDMGFLEIYDLKGGITSWQKTQTTTK